MPVQTSPAVPVGRADGVGPVASADLGIDRVESLIVDAPTTRRHRLSTTEIRHQSLVLVRVILADGAVGYGEGTTLGGPRWSEESAESIKACVDRYLVPAIAGIAANRFEAIALAMSKAAVRNFSAKAAVESALYDAVGRSLGLPASQLLGGRLHDGFEVIWALASGDVEQEIEEARARSLRAASTDGSRSRSASTHRRPTWCVSAGSPRRCPGASSSWT